MKRIYIKTLLATTLMVWLLGGCSGILDEQPRSTYVPANFQTELGIQGALTSLYAHLRWIYGEGYYFNCCETGTDEYTWAQSADNNFKDHDMSGVGSLTPSSSRADRLWDNSFYDINTASAIIENAKGLGFSDAFIAEARFFRAFDYFNLVQTFGGVPLDLGAGELKFNTSPSSYSVRNTVPEVYTKAVFPDLLTAINDLPPNPRLTGTATKTLARLILAKAYLTYGWWLENPNGIPTYPLCPRTDPDGHDANWYYQAAYDVAMAGIASHGSFALRPTVYDLNLAQNDRNSEVLLYADHTESSAYYNGGDLSSGSPDNGSNGAAWMVTWNYPGIKNADGVNPVQREAEQHLGRPWTRMAPTIEAITNTFADKTNDSRYDATFTTVFRGNWYKNLASASDVARLTVKAANGLTVGRDEPILTFLDSDPGGITYPGGTDGGNVGFGVIAGRSDWVVPPTSISRLKYPGLWKIGTYRTDNAGGLGYPNGGITRPFPIAKLSELYFIAAEADVKGATPTAGNTAYDLINVIRARAGVWNWDNNNNTGKVENNSAAMIALTPLTIDIDYILAERSREYFGEGYRWFDLVRTQTWATKAASYTICGVGTNDHTPIVFNRTISPLNYLRPIPQSTIDAFIMTADERAAYQNPQP
jgi:starch-binding outer membrane protein, SusD/RagB family